MIEHLLSQSALWHLIAWSLLAFGIDIVFSEDRPLAKQVSFYPYFLVPAVALVLGSPEQRTFAVSFYVINVTMVATVATVLKNRIIEDFREDAEAYRNHVLYFANNYQSIAIDGEMDAEFRKELALGLRVMYNRLFGAFSPMVDYNEVVAVRSLGHRLSSCVSHKLVGGHPKPMPALSDYVGSNTNSLSAYDGFREGLIATNDDLLAKTNELLDSVSPIVYVKHFFKVILFGMDYARRGHNVTG